MKWTSVLLVVAVAVCGMGLTAQAQDWNAYVIYAHALAPDYDLTYCYDSAGAIKWSVGDGIVGNNNPSGLDLGTNGLLHVSYWDGSRFQTFERTIGTLHHSNITVGGPPRDIVAGPDGNVYVFVNGAGIKRYNALTGAFVDTFISTGDSYNGIAFGPDGHLYACTTTTVKQYDGTTGAVLNGAFITSGTSFGKLKWHNGDLYVSEQNATGGAWGTPDGSIRRYNSTGTHLGDFVAPGAGGLKNPQGFDFTPDGGVLVSEYQSASNDDLGVLQYDNTGTFVGVFAAAPPGDFTPDAWSLDVAVEIVPNVRDHIEYYSIAGGGSPTDLVQAYDSSVSLLWSSTDGGNNSYQMLALGPDDRVYVSSWDGKCVHRFNRLTGAYINSFGTSGGPRPTDITFGSDGLLYLIHADPSTGVHRYNPDTGAYIDHFVSASGLRGLAFGPDGNLYVCNLNTVMQHDGSTGALLNGSFGVGGVNLNRMTWYNGDLYVSDYGGGGGAGGDGLVRRYSDTGAYLGDFVLAGAGGLENPVGLAFTPDGYLLVCDYYPQSIVRRYSAQTGAFVDNHINLGLGEYIEGVAVWEFPVSGTVVIVR